MLILMMRGINAVATRRHDIYTMHYEDKLITSSVMKVIHFTNLTGCSVCITDGSNLRITRLRWALMA
jgi:hypothetical protein